MKMGSEDRSSSGFEAFVQGQPFGFQHGMFARQHFLALAKLAILVENGLAPDAKKRGANR